MQQPLQGPDSIALEACPQGMKKSQQFSVDVNVKAGRFVCI